jgi:AraC family transcriptional regulator, alkane utilization regulator
MDVLSEILRPMRLVSSIISRARFTAPWGVRTSGVRGAIFHVVTSGECFLRDEPSGERYPLARGDLVLLSHGGPHTLSDGPSTENVVPIVTLPRRSGTAIDFGGPGAPTEILCGYFRLDHFAGAALLSALPKVVHVSRGQTEIVEWFDVTLSMVDREIALGRPGADAVVARLLDVLFVQLLRTAATSLPPTRAGWLAAVRDEQIGRALALIHNEPGEKWTAERLARKAGLSRSIFFERFTDLVGATPARYVAQWRVLAAADQLRQGDADIASLSDRLGYGSEDAFARAFKRTIAMTPREYRTAVTSGADMSAIAERALHRAAERVH